MPTLPPDFFLIILKLCTAHLISDYFLQFNSWVQDKALKKIRSPKLYAHILVTFLAAGILSGEWAIALFVALTHGLIDIGKLYLGRKDSVSFVIDQLLHFAVIIACGFYLSRDVQVWVVFFADLSTSFAFWACLLGYLLVTFPMSVVMTILTHRWRKELNDTYQNLETLNEAGKWIGIMERLLILTFILANQFTAIGFLIAAKAVLRFRDTERKLSEYVLIGTLLSISVTVSIGLLLKFIVPPQTP